MASQGSRSSSFHPNARDDSISIQPGGSSKLHGNFDSSVLKLPSAKCEERHDRRYRKNPGGDARAPMPTGSAAQ